MKTAGQSVWNHAANLTFDQALEKWSQILPGDRVAREAALMNALESGKVRYRRADQNTMSNQKSRYYGVDHMDPQSVHDLRENGLLSIDAKSFDQWQRAVDEELMSGAAHNDKVVSEREKTTYENIIGALLTLLLTDKEDNTNGKIRTGVQQYRKYQTQSQLIDTLLESYGGLPGISQKTLEMKLKASRETFKANRLDSQLRK